MSGRFTFNFTTDLRAAPRLVRLSFWLTAAWAAFTALSALVLMGHRTYVHDQLIKSNAKADHPTLNYTGSTVDHDVNRVIYGGLVTGLLSALILVLLGVLMLKGRGFARWILILVATVVPIVLRVGIGILFQLLAGLGDNSAPILYRIPLVIAGLCSAGVLVGLLMPESRRFFAAHRPPARTRAPRSGSRPARAPLFGSRSARRSGEVVDVEPADPADPADPAGPGEPVSEAVTGARPEPRNRKVSTRPGSVKPKGGGPRPVKYKSRNQ